MPLETTIWNINDGLKPITFSAPDTEMDLEDVIFKKIEIIDPNLLIVGRQVTTDFGGRIDILAMDVDGDLCVIELKKEKTPREVVAQVLDYASWIQNLTVERIKDIFRQNNPDLEIEQKFFEQFDTELPEIINENHRLIIVASELDASTERILHYLNETFGVPINVIFLRYFKDGMNKFLSRTWMVDPNIIEQQSKQTKTREPWNQKDFYVSFGADEHRDWEDARKYGFISAGHGEWYSRTLKQLFIGARVFSYIPHEGYVGVGTVMDTVKLIKDFFVEVNGVERPILECKLVTSDMGKDSNDLALSEYMVKVEWTKTIPRKDAYKEVGLFANQNTVCKLRNQFTLGKLYAFFELEE